MSTTLTQTLLQNQNKDANIEPEQRRRLLACGLDELEREAAQFERTLIQWLNQVRALQGKKPVIVPRG